MLAEPQRGDRLHRGDQHEELDAAADRHHPDALARVAAPPDLGDHLSEVKHHQEQAGQRGRHPRIGDPLRRGDDLAAPHADPRESGGVAVVQVVAGGEVRDQADQVEGRDRHAQAHAAGPERQPHEPDQAHRQHAHGGVAPAQDPREIGGHRGAHRHHFHDRDGAHAQADDRKQQVRQVGAAADPDVEVDQCEGEADPRHQRPCQVDPAHACPVATARRRAARG